MIGCRGHQSITSCGEADAAGVAIVRLLHRVRSLCCSISHLKLTVCWTDPYGWHQSGSQTAELMAKMIASGGVHLCSLHLDGIFTNAALLRFAQMFRSQHCSLKKVYSFTLGTRDATCLPCEPCEQLLKLWVIASVLQISASLVSQCLNLHGGRLRLPFNSILHSWNSKWSLTTPCVSSICRNCTFPAACDFVFVVAGFGTSRLSGECLSRLPWWSNRFLFNGFGVMLWATYSIDASSVHDNLTVNPG